MTGEGRDMLYLAITRPAMKLGVPVEGLCLNLLFCYLAFLWVAHANPITFRGVVFLLMLPCVHFVMRLRVSIDHNLFRIISSPRRPAVCRHAACPCCGPCPGN